MEWDREIDDLEIIKKLQNDPTDEERKECVDKLYNKYHGLIKWLILRKLPDIDAIDWQQCVQDVFGNFFTMGYRKFDINRVYSSKNCLKGYLCRSAENVLKSEWREKKRTIQTRGGLVSKEYDGDDKKKRDKIEDHEDESILPLDERLVIKEMFEVAIYHICHLKNKIQLQCIMLNVVFCIKQKILHKIFGYPEGTIKSYISRAAKKMNEKVKGKYGPLPLVRNSDLTEISEEVIREKLSPEEYDFIGNLRRDDVCEFDSRINEKKVATIREKLAYIIDRMGKSVG